MSTLKCKLAFLAISCILTFPSLCSQDIARPSHKEVIPKASYKTWSLFLICNPRWMADDRAEDLTKLYKAFEAFGQTIGRNHLAVWFWTHPYQGGKTTIDDVDLKRSSEFCSAYRLAPSKGPYIVVTSTYPDSSQGKGKPPADSAWFALAAMKPSEISDLLAQLADQLVANATLNGTPKPSTVSDTTPTAPSSWDTRLLAAAQNLMNRLGCAWTLKVETEVVKAELQACTK